MLLNSLVSELKRAAAGYLSAQRKEMDHTSVCVCVCVCVLHGSLADMN